MQYFDLVRQGHSTWQSAGKRIKLHGRLWGPGIWGPGIWGPGGTVLKPSINVIFRPGKAGAFDRQSAGNGVKLHGGVWGFGGRFLKASINAIFRPGKAGAKGERCTGGFRVLVKGAY